MAAQFYHGDVLVLEDCTMRYGCADVKLAHSQDFVVNQASTGVVTNPDEGAEQLTETIRQAVTANIPQRRLEPPLSEEADPQVF